MYSPTVVHVVKMFPVRRTVSHAEVQKRTTPLPMSSAIVIFKADDVVLFATASRLHLDENHRFAALAGYPVRTPAGNVHVLPRFELHLAAVEGDGGGAAHDKPMLCAPAVFLIAQAVALVNRDPLYLVTVGVGQDLPSAPWCCDRLRHSCFLAGVPPEEAAEGILREL
jgi:hypothetical protein